MKRIGLLITVMVTLLASAIFTGFRFADEPGLSAPVTPINHTYFASAATASDNTSGFTTTSFLSEGLSSANLSSVNLSSVNLSSVNLSSEDSSDESSDSLVLSFLGDSITAGYRTTRAYEYFLGDLMDADTVNNYGISQTQLSCGYDYDLEEAFVNRYEEIDEDSDLIFILGGTNDWRHCATLGSLGDTTSNTFYGSLDFLLSSLQEEYPNAKLVIATPLKRNGNRDDYGFYYNEDGEYCNTNGDTLEDFANAVIEVAGKYNVQVVDLYHNEACDFTSDTDYTTYWTDGLHPNAYADSIIANEIYKEIGDLFS